MRKLPWGVLSLVTVLAGMNLVFIGCGSEGDDAVVTGDDGGDGNASSTSSSSGSTSSSSGSTSSSSGGTDSGGSDAGFDALACKNNGTSCTLANECCTNNCIAVDDAGTTKVCGTPITACTPTGQGCTGAGECCGLSCKNNLCQQCVADSPVAGNCANNADCCSQNCVSGKCAPVPVPGGGGVPACRTEGNPCTAAGDCCSGYCNGGTCTTVSFCSQNNDVCANDFECCGGNCVKAAGASLGRCQALPSGGGCNPTGTVCNTNGCETSCCSKSCGPFGPTGTRVCQPPAGCKPEYELCATDDDCCGSANLPQGQTNQGPVVCEKPTGEPYGRCTKHNQCSSPGQICKVSGNACGVNNRCCEPLTFPDGGAVPSNYCQSNPDNCCGFDSLGIPRCRITLYECGDGGTVPAGTVCATSADCCGQPCVDNKCGTSCVMSGGACTANADCCAGLPCTIPSGSTQGICGGTLTPDGGVTPPPEAGAPDAATMDGAAPDAAADAGICALYGQDCTMNSDCCNAVPCTSGKCRFP